MPAVTNAVPYLVSTSSTNDHRYNFLGQGYTRLNQVQEWAVEWLGTPPETEQASTPSGYTWAGYRNDLIDVWATDGTDVALWRHVDTYTKKGSWVAD